MMRIQSSPRGYQVLIATLAIAFLMAAPASAGTLDQIRQSGKLTIGYLSNASPFSYRDVSGNPAGYAVVLGQKIAEQVKAELKLSKLTVQWVPVTKEGYLVNLQRGKIDLLCADIESLERRKTLDFTIPIFPGGIGALVRADSPRRLREILTEGQAVTSKPLWRGSPAEFLNQQTFSVVKGSPSEKWLAGRIDKFQISARVVPVGTLDEGIKRVLETNSTVLFGERAVLLDAVKRSPSAKDLLVLDRRFTNERIAFALRRCDDDFRLFLDRTLSRIYSSPDFQFIFTKWFGAPSKLVLDYFSLNTLPE